MLLKNLINQGHVSSLAFFSRHGTYITHCTVKTSKFGQVQVKRCLLFHKLHNSASVSYHPSGIQLSVLCPEI